MICKNCGNEVEPILLRSGPHVGKFCPCCLTWYGWIKQNENANNIMLKSDYEKIKGENI